MALEHAQMTGTHLFQCIVQGEPLPTIRWTKDGEDIKDDPRFLFDCTENGVVSMVIRGVIPNDSGHYQCIAENSEGFAVSSSHLVVKGVKDHPPSSPCISMQIMEVDESDGFHEIVTHSQNLNTPNTSPSTPTTQEEAPIPENDVNSTQAENNIVSTILPLQHPTTYLQGLAQKPPPQSSPIEDKATGSLDQHSYKTVEHFQDPEGLPPLLLAHHSNDLVATTPVKSPTFQYRFAGFQDQNTSKCDNANNMASLDTHAQPKSSSTKTSPQSPPAPLTSTDKATTEHMSNNKGLTLLLSSSRPTCPQSRCLEAHKSTNSPFTNTLRDGEESTTKECNDSSSRSTESQNPLSLSSVEDEPSQTPTTPRKIEDLQDSVNEELSDLAEQDTGTRSQLNTCHLPQGSIDELQTSISEEFTSMQNDSGFFETSLMSLNDSSVETPGQGSKTDVSRVHIRSFETQPEINYPETDYSNPASQLQEMAEMQRTETLHLESNLSDHNEGQNVTNVHTIQERKDNSAVSRQLQFIDHNHHFRSSQSNSVSDTVNGQSPFPEDGTNPKFNRSSDDTPDMTKEGDEHQPDSLQEPSTTWVDHVESRTESRPEEVHGDSSVGDARATDMDNRYHFFRPEEEQHLQSVADNHDPIDNISGTHHQIPNPSIVWVKNVDAALSCSKAGCSLVLSLPPSNTSWQQRDAERAEPGSRHADLGENTSFRGTTETEEHKHKDQGCNDPDIKNTNAAPSSEGSGSTLRETYNQTIEDQQPTASSSREIPASLPLQPFTSIPFTQIVQQLSTLDSSTVEVLESSEDNETITRDTYRISGSDLDGHGSSQDDNGAFAISDVIRTALADGSIQLSFTATMQIPQFVRPPDDVTVATSDTIVLTCVVRGYPEPNVTWAKGQDGSELKSSDRITHTKEGEVHRLEIRSAGPSDSGQYVCTASNSEGHVIATVTVTVKDFGSSVDDIHSPVNSNTSECSQNPRLFKRKANTTEHTSRSHMGEAEANMAAGTDEKEGRHEDESNTNFDEDQGAVGGQLLPSAGHSVSRSPQDSRSMRYAKLVGMAAAFSFAALGVNKVFEILHK